MRLILAAFCVMACAGFGPTTGALNGSGPGQAALGGELPKDAVGMLGTPRHGHALGAIAVAFSPDGRYLVSGGKAGVRRGPTIHIRDAESSRLVRELATNGSEVRSLAFSSDGSTLATGGNDDRIWIWDVATWTVRRRLGGQLPPTMQVAFAPDNKTLASCHWGREDPNEDHSVLLWDCATGQKVGELNSRSGVIESFSFSPDGKTLALGGWDATVRIWDVPGRKELRRLDDNSGPLHAVAFSPDGRTLASLSWDASIRIWDPAEAQLLLKFDGSFGRNLGFPRNAYTLAYSPGGDVLAVALRGASGGRCPIVLADGSTGLFIRELVGYHRSWIGDVIFSPDGTGLASAGGDGTVRLWDVASGLEKRPASGHAGSVECVAFSPDGMRLATGGADHVICIWDKATNHELFRCEGHRSAVRTVAFSPDGATLASGALDRTVALWNAATGWPVHLWKHAAAISVVAFSPDGSALAAADGSGTIMVREVKSGKEIARLACQDEFGQGALFNSIAYAPKGGILVSADVGGSIRFWRLDGQKPFRVIRQNSVQSVCFAPGGLLAAAGLGGPVRLYDPATGNEVRRFTGAEGSDDYTSVAFAGNGKWLATGGCDGKVRLWNVISGREVRAFSHKHEVTSVAFSPDSSLLASGSEDCLTLLWSCP
jgi:WD40 repeat protein